MIEWRNKWINERMKELINNRKKEWMYERLNERTNQWTNERTNERTNEQMNERTNEKRTNEWIACWIQGSIGNWLNWLQLAYFPYLSTRLHLPVSSGHLIPFCMMQLAASLLHHENKDIHGTISIWDKSIVDLKLN